MLRVLLSYAFIFSFFDPGWVCCMRREMERTNKELNQRDW